MSDDEAPVVKTDNQSAVVEVVAPVTAALVVLVVFGLLALDVSWFWIVFPVGFGGLLPAAVGIARYYQQSDSTDETTENDDPVEALKNQYARGKIDDAEFERRLENLLGTDWDLTTDEAGAKTVERETTHE
jgi:Predicted membrane protein (DUF2078).